MVATVSPNRIIATWLLVCAVATAPIEAGVVMSLRTTDYSTPEPRVEDTRMVVRPPAAGKKQRPGLLRMDITSIKTDRPAQAAERNHTLIFRGGESSSITVIDHREKSYSVIEHASMAAFNTQMRMMMEATAMRVESLPPEQREIVRKMLESQFGAEREATPPAPAAMIKTSDRETLNDWPCIKFEVFRGGSKLREVWVAPPAVVRGGESALVLLRQMSDFYGELMGSFEKVASRVGAGFRLDRNPFRDLIRMQGFPVLTRNFSSGRVHTEVALLSVDERRVPAAEFAIPEGYRLAAAATEPSKR